MCSFLYNSIVSFYVRRPHTLPGDLNDLLGGLHKTTSSSDSPNGNHDPTNILEVRLFGEGTIMRHFRTAHQIAPPRNSNRTLHERIH